ncbi:MAG: hypothetical protein ACXAEU_19490 [Candidatus Hodarchaeales archaeon]|jgi:hypothetical protein
MLVPSIDYGLTIVDFIVIVGIETSLVFFFIPKRQLKQVITLVGIINLLKMETVSLIYSVFNQAGYYYYNYQTIAVTVLMLAGTVLGTAIYEREFILRREQASSLAFQVTILSTFSWIALVTSGIISGNYWNVYEYRTLDILPGAIFADISGIPSLILQVCIVFGAAWLLVKYMKRDGKEIVEALDPS